MEHKALNLTSLSSFNTDDMLEGIALFSPAAAMHTNSQSILSTAGRNYPLHLADYSELSRGLQQKFIDNLPSATLLRETDRQTNKARNITALAQVKA